MDRSYAHRPSRALGGRVYKWNLIGQSLLRREHSGASLALKGGPGKGYACSAFPLGSAKGWMPGSRKERTSKDSEGRLAPGCPGMQLRVLLGGLPCTVGAISLSGRPPGLSSSQIEVLSVPGQGPSSSKTGPSSSISLGPGCSVRAVVLSLGQWGGSHRTFGNVWRHCCFSQPGKVGWGPPGTPSAEVGMPIGIPQSTGQPPCPPRERHRSIREQCAKAGKPRLTSCCSESQDDEIQGTAQGRAYRMKGALAFSSSERSLLTLFLPTRHPAK